MIHILISSPTFGSIRSRRSRACSVSPSFAYPHATLYWVSGPSDPITSARAIHSRARSTGMTAFYAGDNTKFAQRLPGQPGIRRGLNLAGLYELARRPAAASPHRRARRRSCSLGFRSKQRMWPHGAAKIESPLFELARVLVRFDHDAFLSAKRLQAILTTFLAMRPFGPSTRTMPAIHGKCAPHVGQILVSLVISLPQWQINVPIAMRLPTMKSGMPTIAPTTVQQSSRPIT